MQLHAARRPVAIACLVLALAAPAAGQPAAQDAHPDIQLFLDAGVPGGPRSRDAFEQLGAQWRDAYAGIVWDLAWLLRPPSQGFVHFFTLIGFLQEQTGQRFGADLAGWQQWIWSQPYDPHPDHGFFKGQWYSRIDPRFAEFFPRGVTSLIRLDEIEWGGVAVNGIPPLEYPERLDADDADYLADGHIVFGIALGGEARAYPKRILAWHEMALDRLGGVELTIVYCTLCGTVIPFESVADGRHLTFGTSGLLYRSNKLMFDDETKSLWNTFEGEPVLGELVGSGLRLTPRAVVTTTWGEWRRRHPETTVLSLDTGHRRNYAEGAAYRTYFGSDDLMFAVSRRDARLRNKEEVLVLRLPDPERPGRAVAAGRHRALPAAQSHPSPRVRGAEPRDRHQRAGSQPGVRRGGRALRAPHRRRTGGRRRRRNLAGVRGSARAGGRRGRAAGARPGAARLLVRLVRAVSRHRADRLILSRRTPSRS